MAYTLPDDPEIFDLCIVRNECFCVMCSSFTGAEGLTF